MYLIICRMCIYRDNALTPSNTMTRRPGTISPQPPRHRRLIVLFWCRLLSFSPSPFLSLPLYVFLLSSSSPRTTANYSSRAEATRRQKQTRRPIPTTGNNKTGGSARGAERGQRKGSAWAALLWKRCPCVALALPGRWAAQGQRSLALPVRCPTFAAVLLLCCSCFAGARHMCGPGLIPAK